MIPLRDNQVRQNAPIVTWALVLLNVLIYLWDRHGQLFGPSIVFADLGMRPAEVVDAIRGVGDHFALVTLFTSMFLHGGFMHILGNMIFLFVFGASVEEAIGSVRFALYYLFWGVAAAAAQIYVDPHSVVPTVGASGAIGGILGSYFLLFPGNKIEVFLPILAFLSFEVSAWVLLGLWFLWQILAPQEGVANWAHVGGFLAGMLTVLILGGREAVLQSREPDYDPLDATPGARRSG
ncbi:rhomboid family intramembrane serine protease [Fimbriimonas ginsengisoli]|uniref:Rhomboid family protein n=1 Tax=Fimbriimonas ginsengisoli Gsoil 348 TaxID=661478 RepID=A0A068NNK9_FIMGI|nr:rhomboid family intramembrane serine protease [Fimbriimonas ginsengisoli]AIE85036.1 rhomboid family protein [Fimbriimonas ginsengisoli Gsoil 348]